MLEVKVDSIKNYIFIKMEGYMSDVEMKNAANQVMSESKKLKANFTIVSDVSKFKPASQEGAIEIQKVQKFLADNGAKKIVRIVESILGKLQFKKNEKELHLNIVEVTTFEEALKHI